MSEKVKTVYILGSPWKILFKDKDPTFEVCSGYAEANERTISIENVHVPDDKDPMDLSMKAQYENQKRVIRHEVIHAFLMESGLDDSSLNAEHWAANEEMVDWFARQFPKIYKVYEELGVL